MKSGHSTNVGIRMSCRPYAKSDDSHCKTLFQNLAERQVVRAWALSCSFEQTVR